MVNNNFQILKRELMVDGIPTSLLHEVTHHKNYSNFKVIVNGSFVLRFL